MAAKEVVQVKIVPETKNTSKMLRLHDHRETNKVGELKIGPRIHSCF